MWGSDKEGGTSNFKGFDNLVETLEVMRYDEDGLNGVELFMFIDNSVTEGAVYKGSSTSRKLFDLVLCLLFNRGENLNIPLKYKNKTRVGLSMRNENTETPRRKNKNK